MLGNSLQKLIQEKLVQKTSKVFIVRILGTALGFLGHVVLARFLGVEEYGTYTLVFSWLMVISLFSRLGFDNMVIRFITKYEVNKEFGKLKGLLKYSKKVILQINIVIAILLSAGIYLFGEHYSQSLKNTFILGFIFCLPMISIAYLKQSNLSGLKLVGISNIPVLIIRHLVLMLMVVISYFSIGKINAPIVMVLNAIAFFVAVVSASHWIRKNLPYVNNSIEPEVKKKYWIQESLPFLVYSGANNISTRIDILLLGFFASFEEIGVYSAVTRLTPLLSFVLGVIATTVKPYISDFFTKNNLDRLRTVVFYSVFSSTISSCFIFIFFMFFGKSLLTFFGEEYVSGYNYLILIIIGHMVGVLTGLSGPLLAMTNHQRLLSKIEIFFLILNILLSIIVATKFGIIGIIISGTFTYILKNIVNSYYCIVSTTVNPTIFNREGFKKIQSLLTPKNKEK